jgi:exosortase A-associated hydrolase 1
VSGETGIVFECGREPLVGILHEPETPAAIGVVIVVGGPQYRVGSHRQFTLLARELARHDHAVLRFDCRGMGDSAGEFPGFEHIGPDVAAAIDALWRAVPGLRGVVLWGLCDAASAALLYAAGDARVRGLVLLNPWVRSETTLARTYLRHYYLARLASREFWGKLISGRLSPLRTLGDLAGNVRAGSAGTSTGFVARMRAGLGAFHGPVLIVLSGNDYTAAEFAGIAAGADWQAVLGRSNVTRHLMPAANHTFSSAAWRDEVAAVTLQLVRSLEAGGAAMRTATTATTWTG